MSFLITMANTNYYATAFQIGGGNETNMNGLGVSSMNTTNMTIYVYTSIRSGFMWEIKGMSARGITQQNIMCIKY